MSKIKVEIKKVEISTVKTHSENPRIIKDKKYKELKSSIQEFGEMLQIREIVVDENNVVLGGNMRLRALQELNFKEITVKQVTGLTEQQKREFVIKDNVNFGEWNWDDLANKWNTEQLNTWGLDLWVPDEDLFEEDEDIKEDVTPKAGDDDYSVFELVMLHENKLKMLSVLNKIKEDNNLEKQEDALMHIVINFKS